MEDVLVSQRFRVGAVLSQEAGIGLAAARDLAGDREGWLLSVEGAESARHEAAYRLRLRAFAGAPLMGSLGGDPTVVAQSDRLLVHFPAFEGRPWSEVFAEVDPARARAMVGALERAARESFALGLPTGPLRIEDLWATPTGPRLLPSAWLPPPVMRRSSAPAEHAHAPAAQDDRRSLMLAVDRLWRVRAAADGDLDADALRSLHVEDASVEIEASLAAALEDASAESGTLMVRTGCPRTLARSVDAWARRVGRPCLVSRPHVARERRRPREASPALLVLVAAHRYADHAATLAQLERRGWIDGRDTLVVIHDRDPEPAMRLFVEGRRSRAAIRRLDLSAGSPDPAPMPVRDDTSRQLLEFLAVADRPVGESLLVRAFGWSRERCAEVLLPLGESGRVELLYGRLHHSSGLQLVADLVEGSAPAISAARRAELAALLAAAAGAVNTRGGGVGRLWTLAVDLIATDPRRAAGVLRKIATRAERDGASLLACSVWHQLVADAARTQPTPEDRVRAAVCLSEQLQVRGELATARAVLDEALRHLDPGRGARTPKERQLEAEIVLRRAQIDLHASAFGEAERRLGELLERAKEGLPAELRARIYLELSWAQLQLGRGHESIGTGELVLRIVDPHRHPDLVARAHNQMGFALYRGSEYASSIVHYERSLRLRQQLGDELGVARTFNNLGLSHRALGQLNEAQRCLEESLERKRRIGDELSAAASLLNLGFVHLDRGDTAAAARAAEQCVEIARTLSHPETEAEAWGLLGEVARAEGRFEQAREHLERDLHMCEADGHEAERLATLRRLAAVLLDLGLGEDAARRLEEARSLLDLAPSRFEAAMLDQLEGELLAASGAAEPALEAFVAASKGFAAVHRPAQQIEAIARRGELEIELGRADRARISAAELDELIARHEMHRLGEHVRRFRRSAARLPASDEPMGADRCLGLLAGLLESGDTEHGLRPERLLSTIAAAIGAKSVQWIRGHDDALELAGQVLRPCTPAAEYVDGTIGRSPGSVRRHGRTWAVGLLGPGPRWLLFGTARELSPSEKQLLRVAGGLLAPPAVDGDEETALASGGDAPAASGPDHGMVGRGPRLRELLRVVDRVAPTDVSVLLLGENGTGKELVARALHRAGPRAQGRFVAVNCASIPTTLLESELFGHERGAFTSAYERRIGRFEQANGGTLFLDEIGEMPLDMQSKLLRVLQERTFTRVGGGENLRTDARVIAATNRDLLEEVREGRFRTDLYYRLNVVTIEVPPLRERREDIGLLAEHFLRKHGPRFGAGVRSISAEALDRLERYSWPGNVRELENLVKSALVFASDEILRLEDLPGSVLADRGPASARRSLEESARAIVAMEDWSEDRPLLPRLELLVAHEAVRRLGNKTRAARLLGITKPTLYARLRRYETLYGASEGPSGD